MSLQPLIWSFPLPRPHAGISLGNGRQGVMVWGDRSLHLTIARTGFWDRRGGNAFSEHTDYQNLKCLLTTGREEEVRVIFRAPQRQPGQPSAPTQLPGGRLDILFPDSFRPVSASFDPSTGKLEVTLKSGEGPSASELMLGIHQSMDAELTWLEIPEPLRGRLTIGFVPAWEYTGKELSLTGCPPVERRQLRHGSYGEILLQRLPSDPSLAIGYADRGDCIVVSTALGSSRADDPSVAAETLLARGDLKSLAASSGSFWKQYFSTLPRLELPDATLVRAFRHGAFRFAGLTHPKGIAATLQGAWMEEYQVPPWSNDYHFNINLQMIYWPALMLGKFDHLNPLWEMIRGWFPALKTVGERFFGASGAMMLPHATDDTCQAIGSFWQGTIDHASTAWMAYLAYLHYRHSGDTRVLGDVAYPLLVGAFEGFWAMIEHRTGDDGAVRMSLPISVSPEYGEGGIGMWGRDASFQLAAIHRIVRSLPQAADALALKPDPRWKQVREQLPAYSTAEVPLNPWDEVSNPPKRRIAVWEGQDLLFSHRHHSHVAGIYPFATLAHGDRQHQSVLNETLKHWTAMGSGRWCAWGLAWAACICARSDRPDGALAWLHWLIDNCENEGLNISLAGLLGAMDEWCGSDDARRKVHEPRAFEIMQLDAHMGIMTAVGELLVQSRDDGIHVLPRVPWRWRECSFDGIHVEGAFVIGATVRSGKVVEVRVDSPLGGTLRLHHGLGSSWETSALDGAGAVAVVQTTPNQTLVFRPREVRSTRA